MHPCQYLRAQLKMQGPGRVGARCPTASALAWYVNVLRIIIQPPQTCDCLSHPDFRPQLLSSSNSNNNNHVLSDPSDYPLASFLLLFTIPVHYLRGIWTTHATKALAVISERPKGPSPSLATVSQRTKLHSCSPFANLQISSATPPIF